MRTAEVIRKIKEQMGIDICSKTIRNYIKKGFVDKPEYDERGANYSEETPQQFCEAYIMVHGNIASEATSDCTFSRGKACAILTSLMCDKCKFYKTAEQLTEDRRRAVDSMKRRGVYQELCAQYPGLKR